MLKRHSRIGIILLLAAIIGWFAVVKPQIAVFSERALAVQVKNKEVKSYNQRLNDIKVIKDQGEAVQKTLRSMYLAMPKQSQIPEVLVMIESIGNASGVTFSAVTVGTPTAGSGVSEVPVSISYNGNLGAVNQFLTAVQNNIRTAVIKNQTLAADKAGNLAVSMQLGLVYQGGTN